MNKTSQIEKAEAFLASHHDSKLLVLPNIWDPLGARMLESLGFPAVATASAAVAFSLGYDDGEHIRFDAMLGVIERIASSVDVPVSADIERGYADTLDGLSENIRQLIRTGAVGINIEDSLEDGRLRPLDEQCARLRAVRRVAQNEGVPLVINARVDLLMNYPKLSQQEKVAETVERAQAYLEAGADCIYPITLGDEKTLREIHDKIQAPINVYANKSAAAMQILEEIGISRLSLGPGLLKTSLTAMKRVAQQLIAYGSYDLFTKDTIDSAEIQKLVSPEKMDGA